MPRLMFCFKVPWPHFEGGNFTPPKAARREVPGEVDAPGPSHAGVAAGFAHYLRVRLRWIGVSKFPATRVVQYQRLESASTWGLALKRSAGTASCFHPNLLCVAGDSFITYPKSPATRFPKFPRYSNEYQSISTSGQR